MSAVQAAGIGPCCAAMLCYHILYCCPMHQQRCSIITWAVKIVEVFVSKTQINSLDACLCTTCAWHPSSAVVSRPVHYAIWIANVPPNVHQLRLMFALPWSQMVEQRRKLPPMVNDRALFTRAAPFYDKSDPFYHSPSQRIGSNYSPHSMLAASILFELFPAVRPCQQYILLSLCLSLPNQRGGCHCVCACGAVLVLVCLESIWRRWQSLTAQASQLVIHVRSMRLAHVRGQASQVVMSVALDVPAGPERTTLPRHTCSVRWCEVRTLHKQAPQPPPPTSGLPFVRSQYAGLQQPEWGWREPQALTPTVRVQAHAVLA